MGPRGTKETALTGGSLPKWGPRGPTEIPFGPYQVPFWVPRLLCGHAWESWMVGAWRSRVVANYLLVLRVTQLHIVRTT